MKDDFLLNEEKLRKFFDTFSPSYVSIDFELGMNDIKISGFDEFKLICERNKESNTYACYNQLKGKRCTENVSVVTHIFLDADEPDKYEKLLTELESLKLKYSLISKSGPIGHQVFLKIPDIEINKDNILDTTRTIKNFIAYLDRKGLVDKACNDIARLCRIWGTINQKKKYKEKVMCRLIDEQKVSKTEIKNNWEVIKGLNVE